MRSLEKQFGLLSQAVDLLLSERSPEARPPFEDRPSVLAIEVRAKRLDQPPALLSAFGEKSAAKFRCGKGPRFKARAGPEGRGSRQVLTDNRREFARIVRLYDKTVKAGRYGALLVAAQCAGSNRQYDRVLSGGVGPESPGQLKPVDAGQTKVSEDCAGPDIPQHGESFFGVPGGLDVVAGAGQYQLRQLQVGGSVVDDQDGLSVHTQSLYAAAWASTPLVTGLELLAIPERMA